MKAEKIAIAKKFEMITDLWSPKIIGELNGQHVKIAKVQGDFVSHEHEQEDELFIVIKGRLFIELEDSTIALNEGEMTIIPKGTMHRPFAPDETHILMFEPISTLNTGNVVNEYTVPDPSRI